MPPDPGTVARPWTAVYPPGVPPEYHLPEVTLPRFLDDAVRDFPHRSSLISGRDVITHVQVREHVADLAEVLQGAGVASGDRVLLGLPNLASLPVALLAIWRVAAVAVPVAADLGEDRLHAIAADAAPVAVIGTRRFVRQLSDDAGRPDTVIVLDDDGWLFPGRRRRLRSWLGRPRRSHGPTPQGQGHGFKPGTSADREADGVTATPRATPTPQDVALLCYPAAKPGAVEPGAGTDVHAVAFTHASLVAAAFQARLWVPDIQAGTERIAVAEPLAEPTPFVLGLALGWLSGASVVCLDDPDPAELARVVDRERPTLLVVGADRIEALLADGDASKRDLTSLRVVLATGEDLPGQLVTDVERRTGSGRIRSCFGLEGAPLTHAQPVYGRSVAGAMGLPVTGTVAAVVDPDHLDVPTPAGEPGRLIVHGPQVASGYWRRDDATARRFVAGWVITDELVTADDDGLFCHLGTIGEVVERGGTWVSPQRIEAVLLRHPAVREAGVVTGSDPEVLHAAVAVGRRGRPTEEDLLVHCRAHLDSPAVPDHVTLLDELPETEAGDLARDALRELLAESDPS
jgi:long-chain acyl-CoA synthetase